MVTELVVTIRDAEKRKLTKEFLLYQPFQWEENDPVINQCVKELLEEFKGEADDIKIKATMVLK